MIAFSPIATGPDRLALAPHPARLRLVSAPVPSAASARVLPGTYRRRQALAAGFVAIAVAVASMVLGALGDGSRSVPGPSLEMSVGSPYVVQPGDTLWSIALRLDPDDDPRPLVDELAAEHGGALLRVGDEIWLPAA